MVVDLTRGIIIIGLGFGLLAACLGNYISMCEGVGNPQDTGIDCWRNCESTRGLEASDDEEETKNNAVEDTGKNIRREAEMATPTKLAV
jgi:hypothetical protein